MIETFSGILVLLLSNSKFTVNSNTIIKNLVPADLFPFSFFFVIKINDALTFSSPISLSKNKNKFHWKYWLMKIKLNCNSTNIIRCHPDWLSWIRTIKNKWHFCAQFIPFFLKIQCMIYLLKQIGWKGRKVSNKRNINIEQNAINCHTNFIGKPASSNWINY